MVILFINQISRQRDFKYNIFTSKVLKHGNENITGSYICLNTSWFMMNNRNVRNFVFFSSLLNWIFLIYIWIVIPFPCFQANILLTPSPSLLYECSPPHPSCITALPKTITFTGGSVFAGQRASPSTGALTRLFIATYAVGAQDQSMYSLWVVA